MRVNCVFNNLCHNHTRWLPSSHVDHPADAATFEMGMDTADDFVVSVRTPRQRITPSWSRPSIRPRRSAWTMVRTSNIAWRNGQPDGSVSAYVTVPGAKTAEPSGAK